jgi:ribosomal protein L40E
LLRKRSQNLNLTRKTSTKNLINTDYPTRVPRKAKMVYCPKCGAVNADDACYCSKCGAALLCGQTSQGQYPPYWRHRHHHGDDYYGKRRGWGALFAGAIIIIIGLTLLLSEVYNISINWNAWAAILVILVGFWLIIIAVRASLRHRPRQPPQA